MKIAITGGSGFVGRHLAEKLTDHEVVSVSRRNGYDLADVVALMDAFEGCDVVAHCAGINREIGEQTYQEVHVEGTRKVIEAAQHAGVKKIVFMSFLRARPDCGSPYHESKWEAEELIRKSGLDYTIIKAGMTYGLGDHMLDHLSHTVQTIPFVPTVGFEPKPVRPLAVEDLVEILEAALLGRMGRSTVYAVGAEEMLFSDAIQRVAENVHRKVLIFPFPVWLHYALAQVWEWTMKVPLAAKAQIRILSEGVTEPAPWADEVPADLKPKRYFTDAMIQKGLPPRGRFTLKDLRWVK